MIDGKEKNFLFFKNGLLNDFGFLIIYNKRTDNFIGSTRYYSYDMNNNAIRIGFTLISTAYWGTLVNFHIKQMMLGYAFDFVDYVYFDIGVKNIRSRKAVEKIGASLFVDNPTGNVVYKLSKQNFKI